MAKKPRATRGYGLFEGLLARLRAKKANSLIPDSARQGCILDIGSGTNPTFLNTIQFKEKVGLDRYEVLPNNPIIDDIDLRNWDFSDKRNLPFDNNSMDVISMLAVFEHIDPDQVSYLVSEIWRVLKPGGVFILTIPARWTDPILHLLAKFRLISAHEINDHKDTYNKAKLLNILTRSDFLVQNVRVGYFELGLNIWVRATK